MLLEQLKTISSEDDVEEEIEGNGQYPCIQHVSFGKYNVFDENKNLLTSKPIKKDEAEKILSEILAKSQMKINGDPDADNPNENRNQNV